MSKNLWILMIFSAGACLAQTTTGSIVGTVSDPSGAVVAGATVTVTNEGTGIVAIKTTTDAAGNYVATTLPVGRYSVAVEAPGFKRSVSSGLILNVQGGLGVDVILEVGQVSDTVQVIGAAPVLETDTSYLGQVVESQRIVDLPLNGRFFTRLAVLTAGTTPTAPGARDERTG